MNLTYVTNIPQLCPVKKVLRAVFTTAFQRQQSTSNITVSFLSDSSVHPTT